MLLLVLLKITKMSFFIMLGNRILNKKDHIKFDNTVFSKPTTIRLNLFKISLVNVFQKI